MPGGPEEERVLSLRDQTGRGELVDERPVHRLAEVKIERVEAALGIAKAGQLVAP